MMRSWIHFTRGRFVRQARVGLCELREEHLSRSRVLRARRDMTFAQHQVGWALDRLCE